MNVTKNNKNCFLQIFFLVILFLSDAKWNIEIHNNLRLKKHNIILKIYNEHCRKLKFFYLFLHSCLLSVSINIRLQPSVDKNKILNSFLYIYKVLSVILRNVWLSISYFYGNILFTIKAHYIANHLNYLEYLVYFNSY